MIDLIGAVALLLWGLRMVKTGIERAFGARLRRWIAQATRNRLTAFAIGLAATLALQSSTATALVTAGIAASGYMSATMAQAIMLGANVGTSLVARLLAFDTHALSPLLVLLGVALFTLSRTKARKGVARAILGLGLMLLALHLLGGATEPMRQSQVLKALMASLAAVPLLAILVAAVLAITASSSLAIVLLVMLLAATGTAPPPLGLALVLGANLGGAVPPVLATLREGPAALRVTVGNLLIRLAGIALVFPFLDEAAALSLSAGADPAQAVVMMHIAFNIALVLLMLPLLDPVSRLMHHLLPDPTLLPNGPLHLDPGNLTEPAMALAGAARETLRIGDCVTAMLESNLAALRNNDTKCCASIAAMDDEVDRLNDAVKLYLAKLSRSALARKDARRSDEIISYAINLEHAGDIVDKNLRELVEKKIRHQLTFSAEGAAEIGELYAITIANLRLAQSILVSGDGTLARRLVESKLDIRKFEERSAANHLERLREGQIESLQTTSLHLDILRDLKRINAHIAAIAYPILEQAGLLRESRLI